MSGHIGATVAGIVAIFAIVITIRGFRNFFRNFSREEDSAPEKLTCQQVEFHTSELSSLKPELVESMKLIASSYQYAVLGSMAIVTWLIATDPTRIAPELLRNVIFLPFGLSLLLYSLSLAQYLRTLDMALYSLRIEKALGAPGLGWVNSQRNRPASLLLIFFFGWVILLGVDLVVAIALPLVEAAPFPI